MNISRINKGRRKGYHKGCFGNKQPQHYTAGEMRQMKPKKTGRGNAAVDEVEAVKKYLRRIHPQIARKMDIAKSTGLGQDRVLIILNLLSGVSEDKDGEFAPKNFLVYEDIDGQNTRYGIYTDVQSGICQGVKTGGEK